MFTCLQGQTFPMTTTLKLEMILCIITQGLEMISNFDKECTTTTVSTTTTTTSTTTTTMFYSLKFTCIW